MSTIMRSRPTAQLAESTEAQARYARSLNRESRKRELQRITRENARILTAIQSSAPVYDVAQWEREAREQKELMRNICEFPVTLFARGGGGGEVPEVDEEYSAARGGGSAGGSAARQW
jgi:hypothetical protein